MTARVTNALVALLARALVQVGDRLALLGLRISTAGLARLGVDLSTPPTSPDPDPPPGWTSLGPVPPAGADEQPSAPPQVLH